MMNLFPNAEKVLEDAKRSMELSRAILALIGDRALCENTDALISDVLNLLSKNHEAALAAMPSIQYYFMEKAMQEARERETLRSAHADIMRDLVESLRKPVEGVTITTEVAADPAASDPPVVAVKCHIPPGF